MKLFNRWYPRTLSERADWHENFAGEAAESGKEHGLTDAEVAQAAIDAQVVRAFNAAGVYLEAQMEKWRDARDAYLDGDTGDAAPEEAEFNVAALPAGALAAIAERTELYVKRIEGSATYSESVGSAYGIIPAAVGQISDDEAKPVGKVSAIAEFKVAVKIPLKGFDGIQAQMERDGDSQTHKTNYPNGDITDETPPLVAGKGESRRYRFYYLRKNKIVGESSELYEVTTHA
jgi:hypothetical protein